MLSETDISKHGGTGSDTGSGRIRRDGAADGQNRIQNDTEQEEADIAGGETDKRQKQGIPKESKDDTDFCRGCTVCKRL